MSRNTYIHTLVLLVTTALACAEAPKESLAATESALTTPPAAALEGAIDAYVTAVLASDADGVRQALSPSASSLIESRLSGRSWEDFVAAERHKLVFALGSEDSKSGFSLARATLVDATTWTVEGSLGGQPLTKALKVEEVDGAYAFAGPGGGGGDSIESTSYRIDNNTSTGHSMKCTGYLIPTSVPANQTTYKSCNNYCGFWVGAQFWDGTTYIGACDYNTFGADVVINGATAQCVGTC